MTTNASTKRLSSVLLTAGLLAVGERGVADWPFARGGADSTGATSVTLPDDATASWTYETTDGSPFEATPVVADGVAYLGDGDGTFHAVRLSDGQAVWTRAFEDVFFVSPAAVVGDAIVAPDADGIVRCFAAADGASCWEADAGAEVYGGPIAHTAADGETLVLVPTEAGRLVALDAATGDIAWEFAIDAPLRCAPTLVDGHALLAGCDGKLHAIDATTGEVAGVCDLGGPTGNTAAVADGVAYTGIEDAVFLAIDVANVAEPRVLWKHADARRRQSIRTAAGVADGTVVYANQGKTLFCLDAATGEPRWTRPVRGGVEASPLLLGDGAVLALTKRGRVVLLDGETGDERWSDDRGGSFLASPAATDGVVLVANTDGTLTCYPGEGAADGR